MGYVDADTLRQAVDAHRTGMAADDIAARLGIPDETLRQLLAAAQKESPSRGNARA